VRPKTSIAAIQQLLRNHREELSEIEIADLTYDLGFQLYILYDGHLLHAFLQQLHPSEKSVLKAHQHLLTAIIYGFEQENAKNLFLELYLAEPIYLKFNHRKLIFLYGAIALHYGENGFLEQAEEYFKKAFELSTKIPDSEEELHYTIANYLFFLHDCYSPPVVLEQRDKIKQYLNVLKQSDHIINKSNAYSLELLYAELLDWIDADISKAIKQAESHFIS